MAERRYSILLYTALGVAVLATFGVYRVLQNTKAKSQVATRAVVVAAKDLPEGASLAGSNVEVKQWPTAAAPTGAFTKAEDLSGRVTQVPVYAGEAIVPGRLAPTGTTPGLEVKVPAGKRAMAVKINDVAGISGLIQPNSNVDVVVTMRSSDVTAQPVSKIFLENVRVLSVGTTVQRNDEGKAIPATTAALELSPDEAERLAVAANEGSIQLVLRGFGDPQTVTTPGAHAHDVLNSLSSAPVAAPQQLAATSAPKPTRRAVRRQTAAGEVAPRPVAPVVVAPVKPAAETLTVTIYHGEKVDHRTFVKPDTARLP